MSRGRPRSSSPAREDLPRGVALLHDPRFNKGTAFTEAEREALGLRGLLPPRVNTPEEQQRRILENFHGKSSALEKYIFLIGLQDRNETAFYRLLIDHVRETMPIVYTPTVGEACARFGHIFRRPRGLWISACDRGRIGETLRNWPEKDVAILVVTDGERILGLGDLGAYGMGIPIGKLALYSACAGIHPRLTLPVMLDVGTGNAELRDDPLYVGLRQSRLRGEEYDALVHELVTAVQQVFPRAVLQFEDFGNANAFRLLARYREQACVFNDDIQGTAAVTLAALLGAGRITGRKLGDERLLFLGAGEAGIGIADLVVFALEREGMTADEARRHCWFVDSKGLVVRAREDLAEHKRRYAHDRAPLRALAEIVRELRPTALIGVSGRAGVFTEEALREIAAIHDQPLVFALSNPTEKAECTAVEAIGATGGRAIFASGSPFDAVEHGGRRIVPSQVNNVYVFPGVGLGAIVSGARRITDELFHAAAMTLAGMTTASGLAARSVLPPVDDIREVSARVATAVATVAWDTGLATRPRPPDVGELVRSGMYDPRYESYV